MPAEPPAKPSFTPRRKWGVGCDVAVRTLIVLAVLVMLNQLSSVFFHRQYLSETSKVELSSRTRSLLQAVTNDVQVTIYFDREDNLYPTVARLLREYQAVNPRVQVTTVDYLRDAAAAQRLKTAHGLPETSKAEEKNFVIFECGPEKRFISGSMLTDTAWGQDEKTGEFFRRATAFKGETIFTAMIRAVTNPVTAKAYVLQGHGEHNLESGDDVAGYLDFLALLRQNAIEVQLLALGGTNMVPADCNLIIVPGPRSTIPDVELAKLDQYLNEGGRLFALFNASSTDRRMGLEKILTKWGVLVTDSIARDPDHSLSRDKTDVVVGAFSQHPAVSGLINFNLNLLSPRVVGPTKAPENGTDAPKVTPLFATEPSAILINNPRAGANAYPLAVAVEKNAVRGVVTGRGTTRMIVVGDSFFLANGPMKLVANREFAGYAINWLLERPQFTEGIGPKSFTEYRMTLTAAQLRTLRWLLLGAVPGGILLFGTLVWWRRQK